MMSWNTAFGVQAAGDDIENIDYFVGKLYAYLCLSQPTQPTGLSETQKKVTAWRSGDDCIASTTRHRPRDVWRFFSRSRTHRVVSELRISDQHWKNGSQRNANTRRSPTGADGQASDDSLVAAMHRLMPKSFEETVMFANADEGFQELYDRRLAHSSTKQSIQMSEEKLKERRSDGRRCAGIRRRKGNAENSNWPKSWKGKGDEHSDGWIWKSDEQADGWKTTDWETKRGSEWWTTANDWTKLESEEPMGRIDINNMESKVDHGKMPKQLEQEPWKV